MKKELGVLVLICLVFMGGIVSANSFFYNESRSEYVMNVDLVKGWNLVQGFHPDLLISGSELGKEDFSVVFMYIPDKNKYLQIYPYLKSSYDELDAIGRSVNDEYYDDSANVHAFWVYSNRAGKVTYRFDPFDDISKVQLKPGWNFIGVTPVMIGKNMSDIKGNCDFQKIYGWSTPELSGGGYWDEIDLSSILTDYVLGKGILLKVSSDCTLGSTSSNVNPPSLPSENTGSSSLTCDDSDGGLNYGVKGSVNNTYKFSFEQDICLSGSVLKENYCTPSQYIVITDSVNYTCPNSCVDGACI